MATYIQDIPSLVPINNANEILLAPAIPAGGLLDENDIALAEYDHSNRKALWKRGDATMPEVRLAKFRKVKVESAHNNFHGFAPAWVADIQQGILTIQQSIQTIVQNNVDIQQTIVQNNVYIVQSFAELHHLSAYNDSVSYNRTTVKTAENLIKEVFHKTTGASPMAADGVWFPVDLRALNDVNEINAISLLTFYGLPHNNILDVNRKSIKDFLGIIDGSR